jgi:endonuclease YncB( thermonuclease family)
VIRLVAAVALATPALAGAGGARGTVVLDGERVAVTWTDGDTFRVREGRLEGRRARVAGVNALETFGPVHRIARAGPEELLAVAREAGPRAAARERRCATSGQADRYGRLLVACPDVAAELVSAGLAMAFFLDGPPDAALLALQAEAQRAGRGMWARGVPAAIVTSVHSAGEPGAAGRAYDRVVDARTGAAVARPHARGYGVCEEVCVGDGDDRSCMRYVPYERWYRDRPPCLRGAP